MSFRHVPDFPGNQSRDTTPLYSMIRACFDLTPIVGTPIFGSNKAPQIGSVDIKAFSYGLADANASSAGFGTKTKPNERHTNLQKAYNVPNGGRGRIESIMVKPEGHILQPCATMPASDPNDVVNDTGGTQQFTDDFKNGYLYSYALRLFESCFVPYYQYGASGGKKYMPSTSFLAPGRFQSDGRVTSHQGAPFVFPEEDGGIEWSDTGNKSNLIIGFEAKRNVTNQAWAGTGATAALFTDIAAALGVANASAPAAGSWMFVVDFTVVAAGFYKYPLNL